MDLENNIWTLFWKPSSFQTAWLWWGPCRGGLCVNSTGRGSAWLNFSLEDCPLPASGSDSFPPSCVPLPLWPTEHPSEQWVPLAFFLGSLSQCWGCCQRVREERLKVEAGLPKWGRDNFVFRISRLKWSHIPTLPSHPQPPAPPSTPTGPFF